MSTRKKSLTATYDINVSTFCNEQGLYTMEYLTDSTLT